MQVIYAKQPFPNSVTRSIMLAGPTPRSPDVPSWRPEAIRLLEETGFGLDGTVFSPEPADGKWDKSGYENQVEWEEKALNVSDCILFWVPRDMQTMPALTTNVEFGFWANSGKVVFGYPPEAPDARRNKYLEYYANKLKIPVSKTLPDLIQEALKKAPLSLASTRTGGECEVPFHIWQSESFQAWYRGQKAVGNRLDGAKVVWTFFTTKVVPVRPVFWALHVNVFVASENRNKVNEIVLSRADISSVVLYKRREPLNTSDIVLVREFRSPVRNREGFVFEAPGGSSFKTGEDPYTVAAHEVFEETGLTIDPERVQRFEDRQLMATMSAHKSHLFAVELEESELDFFRTQAGVPHGVIEDSEQTFVEVMKLSDLYTSNVVDWSMIGMIHRVLSGPQFIPAASAPRVPRQ